MTVDLGQILIDSGRLSPPQLQEAQARSAQTGRGLDEALTALELVTEEQVADALGRHFEIPGLCLAKLPRPNPRVTRVIPEKVARERRVVPLERAGDTLILLMQDPTDIQTINLVRAKAQLEVQPVVASTATVREALEAFYPSLEKRLLDSVVPFVAKLITEEAARTYRALPVDREGGLITVVLAGADHEKIKRAIELATGLEVRPLAGKWEDVERAIVRIWHPTAAPVRPAAPAPPAAVATPGPAPAPVTLPAGPPTKSLDDMLGGALTAGGGPVPTPPQVVAGPRPATPGGLSLDLGPTAASPSPKSAAATSGGLSLDLTLAPGQREPASASRAPAGSGLSIDLGEGMGPKETPRTAAVSGGLALDLGSPGAGTPPPAPPAAARPAGSKPGNGGSLLDDLLKETAAPAAPRAAAPAAPAAPGLTLDGLEKLAAAIDETRSPDLSAAGGPEGPRTGLRVEASTRQQMKELAWKTWGDLDVKLAKLVPEKVARNYRVVVTGRREKTLFVAMENPSDTFAIETLMFVSGLRIEATPATPEVVAAGLEVLYTPDDDEMAAIMDELAGIGLDDVEAREELAALSDLDAAHAAEAAPVVKLVNLVIDNAIRARASDVHLEVFEDSLRIRYRIDGVLREVMRPPLQLRDAVTSRVKIMGRMDISERRLPQDGRVRMLKGPKGDKQPIDFRISSIPTVFGEKLVMRILDKAQIRTDLTQLGLEPEPLVYFREAIHRPYGMCLVVGPSGCGKTNTLYSALADVNTPDVNIITCEDPVEFSTRGLNQVQAKDSIGLTFATALRSFLRQDPNIILVGEIRDFETAEIAIKAALTGHMVLSTLHTNDAAACLNRLTNMGVEPFLIATSLHVIVAQRLVRTICAACKVKDDRTRLEQLVQMGFTPDEARPLQPMRGTGCRECDGTGYRGRTGLFEVMRVTDDMREMILYNGTQTEIKDLAKRQGMRTLRQSGLVKIAAGVTSCEEVVRETIA
jgi:type IV pilus assembly protein PilB